MIAQNAKLTTAVFITFSGNCKTALRFYQSCFGGTLQFQTFKEELPGFMEMPVIYGSLISDRLVVHGSDMVHSEGRKAGNFMAIFLPCKDIDDRNLLVGKLGANGKGFLSESNDDQKLIELTDEFEVRWILGVCGGKNCV